MRIIAGERRGMKLLSPKSMSTRPITDRVKEAVFSILVNSCSMPGECKVADLFCGTGSLGLEALSRGADYVAFVEQDKQVVEILEQNIEKARFGERCEVISADAFRSGAPVLSAEEKFDLVFVDPPYPTTKDISQNSRIGKLMIILAGQIKQDGLILVRTHKRTVMDDEYGLLEVCRRRSWGNMTETFFKLKGEESQETE
ncbi:16S rRNA (guanine(966)-N(2))-methyltransferase RsmD [Sedimentisphaera salicampi]|uniref:Ribosomal RNA small subunit methyltransferase D n=1 Tax=Sedimentisphaera salicampi TaxID=1941349 RepID=A0A1W6LPT7_9BACT|nr:16S rRNA (guanine(966)-N(2))-methyltransferase RsmD [Sedimentisphaera salicampi]ARN57742.1 Ribosomal RNA small subunit methyltransferase D [Sedimentisphaera salicampi]